MVKLTPEISVSRLNGIALGTGLIIHKFYYGVFFLFLFWEICLVVEVESI